MSSLIGALYAYEYRLWFGFLILKKCVVLQVNDAAISLRLVVFVSKVQRLYTDYSTDWMGGRGERRGVPPL
jgi:hypothetical protein